MLSLYHDTCLDCSRQITHSYSTSFSMGIKLFDPAFRAPIYSIYGFVRFADEIVDTFFDWDRRDLLDRFRQDTYRAIDEGISLNPVLHSFQKVVREYNISVDLIDAFLDSMAMDLTPVDFDQELYERYIYGSAQVVGLMCLRVFVKGDCERYEQLLPTACSLGAAFQKVNFLRDIQSDFEDRGRVYFPGVSYSSFTPEQKAEIESDIQQDFDHAIIGIRQLPVGARHGVYLAYIYYLNLLKQIKAKKAEQVKQQRVRVPDAKKMALLITSSIKYRLGAL